MILTVTPNPAIDRTYTVPEFALDKVNRPTAMLQTAGGKGVNVARAFRTLGGTAQAIGFLGGASGEELHGLLHQEGISGDWVSVSGETRVCYQLYDPRSGALTELNENGPVVSDANCVLLTRRLKELLPGCQAVVFSGSLPPGAPVTLYQEWIALAQTSFGVPAFLDTSAEALIAGVAARPFLVKPNRQEIKILVEVDEDCERSAQRIREKFGVACVLVTDGPRGAVLATPDGVWQGIPPPVDVVSALGSGDTLLAAFVWAHLNSYSWPDALRSGVAAGAANTLSLGAALFSRVQADELAAQTIVRRLSGKA